MNQNFRIFVEKKFQFNIESQDLLLDFQTNLNLPNLKNVKIINFYDIFNISENDLNKAKYTIFAQKNTDYLYNEIDLKNKIYFAVSYLPGQYDQRSDAAKECLQLLNVDISNTEIVTGKLLILEGNLSKLDINKIKNYYINPNEFYEKDLTSLVRDKLGESNQDINIIHSFNSLNSNELKEFINDNNLAMDIADLKLIQEYFIQIARNPTITEIKVLDVYWSDHCRHKTFHTKLKNIEITEGKYKRLFSETLNNYYSLRNNYYGNNNKAVTLMDMATIYAKYAIKNKIINNVEISDEINASSLLVEIKSNKKKILWSIQFKNETHNHPTEIEPYGGAATCLGGAIRDPLSGRAYVYQAVRISGSGDPTQDIKETLKGKLPQRVIATKAAKGFSGYGNQIGVATTLVDEIYHLGYIAKRMEVGMVVAGTQYKNIIRNEPTLGDVVILLGGKTGKDGCGGATGSSKMHDEKSASFASVEVQKGNPVIERKIQRLFRNSKITKLIKKCNDFGAGGVAVAIGELAKGITIDLDKIPVKYLGLTVTELAISESQERMAVVINRKDINNFIKYAHEENLDATVVANITNDNKLKMLFNGLVVVDLDRDFLDTGGLQKEIEVQIDSINEEYKEILPKGNTFLEKIIANLSNINVASKKGLVEMFDATIGATTILSPFGGKYQETPVQISAQKLPTLNEDTNFATIVSYGFDPKLSSYSPFHGAIYAVIDSVAKIVSSGADFKTIRFSFQEYFESLKDDPLKWGKPVASLLGAFLAQQKFLLPAIGGKDSMSGSFNDLSVPPTLISFAVATGNSNEIISPEFKSSNSYVYILLPKINQDFTPDFEHLKDSYEFIYNKIKNNIIISAMAIGVGGILASICKMSFGNKIGFKFNNFYNEIDELFLSKYGAIVFESTALINNENLQLLGTTIKEESIIINNETFLLKMLLEKWQCPLKDIFNFNNKVDSKELNDFNEVISNIKKTKIEKNIIISSLKIAKPRVIIPVFPGTNCEYDSAYAFNNAGAKCKTLIFRNLTSNDIKKSIKNFAKKIIDSQILMLPGGFSLGDEPDGSAKFIATILRNELIAESIHKLLENGGLILGICNGFQALIKSGLIPYGKITNIDETAPTLTHNLINRHMATISRTKIMSNHSPWLQSFAIGECHNVAISHGEGRIVIDREMFIKLFNNGQIATMYVDLNNEPTIDGSFNPNGSKYAIEGILAFNGQILGKMGHSERFRQHLYKNIPDFKKQDIFLNGVNYFR